MTCLFRPPFRTIVCLAALALSLAACGRRGPLEPPPGAPASNAPLTGTPDAYAPPRSVADLPGENAAGSVNAEPSGAAQSAPQSTPAKPAPPAAKAPPKPFPLDPLL